MYSRAMNGHFDKHGRKGPSSSGNAGGSPFDVSPTAKQWYDTLGVQSSATPEEIRKAYQKAMAKHHPDRTGGDDTKAKELSNAYARIKTHLKGQGVNLSH